MGRALIVTGEKFPWQVTLLETTDRKAKLLGQPLPVTVFTRTVAGQRVAWDFDRHVAEFQVRVAVLNGFTALCIPVTQPFGSACLGTGAFLSSS